jgi:integrase
LPAKDRKITLGEFTAEWIDSSLEASDRKATTKNLYGTMARTHIIGAKIGAKPLDKLRPSHIDAWTVELKGRELAESSIRTAYTVLRAVLDTAVRDKAIAQNQAQAVRRPKVTGKEAAYLTPDQVRSLLIAAEGSRYAPLFALLVNSGLRRGEALALHWSDIDFDAKLLRVRGTLARLDGELVVTETKTAKSRRVVPLSPTAEKVLRDMRTRQMAERLRAGAMWQPTPYAFTTELGEPCDPRNALRALKAAAKRANLPSTVGLHTLRHSAASVMLSAGVPLKVVSEIFGHASVAITGDVYGHVSPDVSREALTRLSDALA